MSLLILRPTTAGAPVGPDPTTPTHPEVPVLLARIAWRTASLTILPWNGSTTTGWTTNGSLLSGPVTSLAPTSSDSFGGGSSFEAVTAGTAASGIDYALTGTFTSGRTYRLRAGVKNVSGSTSLVLRLGNAADAAASTATTTTDWAWYTVDWTPSGDRTDAVASLRNGAAATQTVRVDHVEVYEAADDVTLESLTTSRGASFDGSNEPPGTIGFDILDPSETYTPRNTASSLYGTVRPGRRVHIRATYGGRLYAVAYGVLRSVTPDPWRRMVTFTAEDGLRELDGYTTYRVTDSAATPRAARAAVLSAEALGTAMHDLTSEGFESSTFVDGTTSSVGLLEYLASLDRATGTLHYCAPHVDAARPWRYRTMSRASLTSDAGAQTLDESFVSLEDVSIRDESLVTRQTVRWQGYEVLPAQSVAWLTPATETWAYASDDYGSGGERIMPLRLEAAESRDLLVSFAWPMEDLSAAVTASATVTSSTATWSQSARLTITAGTAAVDVTAVTWTGSPLRPFGVEEASGTAVGSDVVIEGSPIDAPISYEPAAQGLAGYVVWRYGTPRLRPSVIDQHAPVRQLTTDIGSRILLSADRWHIDGVLFVVRGIGHEVSGGGWSWRTTYQLEELPTGTKWLTLDAGAAYGLDGTATLAY